MSICQGQRITSTLQRLLLLSSPKSRIYKIHQRRNISSIHNDSNNRWFKISFGNGECGIFPYVWLRDTSLDGTTYSITDSMKARNLMMRDFDVEVVPEKFELNKDKNELKILWPGNVEARYPATWLKSRNLSSNTVRSHRRNIYLPPGKLWNKEEIEKRLQRFDHEKVMTDDKSLHDFLYAVCCDGIAVLKNGPKKDKETVTKIGDRIGLIHQTHFGKIFEVTTKVEASNMAYAHGGELPYHTDFPSLSQPPELQMLYMYQKAPNNGGLSMFVDGFYIATIMKEKYPDEYKLLTETPIEFIEEGYDIHERDGKDFKFTFDMAAKHRTIKLDESGNVIKIQFGNAMRSWFFDTQPEKIQDIYRALKLFTTLCYAPENQLIFPLENGDTVLWANTRLLHARSGYQSTKEDNRSIFGCYFMWDIVKSRIRVIRDTFKLEDNQNSL